MNNDETTTRGEAWETCDRCGLDYSKSKLTRQRGILVCPWCKDRNTGENIERDLPPISDERIVV